MARPREAQVKERRLADDSVAYWARITVAVDDRRPVVLGYSREGIDREQACEELKRQQALVTLGKWEDPRPAEPTGDEVLFHAYASEWFAVKRRELSTGGKADYKWRLTSHLLPFFGPYRLDQIDRRLVDRYRAAKLEERDEIAGRLAAGERLVDERGQPAKPLSNTSINKTLKVLCAILELAVDHRLIAENPALGKRRRLKERKPRRTWLMPDQALDLIDAAERIDRRTKPDTRERALHVQTLIRDQGFTLKRAAGEVGLGVPATCRLAHLPLPEREPSIRRAIISTLVLGGLRASELCRLRWRDIDFTNRRITVPGTKSDAAERPVKLVDFLREELLRWKLDAPSIEPDDLVFPTRTGRRRDPGNLRNRVVAPAIREANRVRRERQLPPLPARVGPQSLRRTFVALVLACGRPVPDVQHQAGHKDAQTTLNIYAQVIDTDFRPTREILARLMQLQRRGIAAGAGDGPQLAAAS